MTTIEIKNFVATYNQLKDDLDMADFVCKECNYKEYNFVERFERLKEEDNDAYAALVKYYAVFGYVTMMHWRNRLILNEHLIRTMNDLLETFEHGEFVVFRNWDDLYNYYAVLGIEDKKLNDEVMRKLKFKYFEAFDGTLIRISK